MPLIQLGDFSCYYRLDGADERPVVMFAHSLGLDHGMWDAQAADLAPHVRVLRYDLRGHGASGATPGDYSIEQLGRDAIALADGLGIARVAFCGLSIGGMIGQWLGANAPERLTHLVLANTSPRVAEPASMDARRRLVLEQGLSAVVETAMGRFFTPAFLASGSPQVASARRVFLANNPVGYAGCCAAVRDHDQRGAIGSIRVPTLVVSGDADVSMPWPDHGDVLARAIPGSRVVRLPAAHISNLEKSRSFSAALMDFLLPRPADAPAAGMAVRRAVLGDAHVDRAIAATTDLTREFQALITEYAWGRIWTRPGLDHRTRRLLVLTTLAAMGRWDEFRMHLRAGLAAELEWCDVKEALLQAAVYAGVPVANTGFHVAAEVFEAGR